MVLIAAATSQSGGAASATASSRSQPLSLVIWLKRPTQLPRSHPYVCEKYISDSSLQKLLSQSARTRVAPSPLLACPSLLCSVTGPVASDCSSLHSLSTQAAPAHNLPTAQPPGPTQLPITTNPKGVLHPGRRKTAQQEPKAVRFGCQQPCQQYQQQQQQQQCARLSGGATSAPTNSSAAGSSSSSVLAAKTGRSR
jgi:hypothetical protein